MSTHKLPTEVIIKLVYDGDSETGVRVDPIVHCKDCVYRVKDEAYIEPWCEYRWRGSFEDGMRIVLDDDFCSRGKRK